jgi:hypothetical protein
MHKLSLASLSLLVSTFTLMAAVLVVLRVPPQGLIGVAMAVAISVGLAFVFAHEPGELHK